ncbi:alkaline phosphatase family protein [Rossellomorea marisflavi]|uniref:alkaline phosphatase family protein n=1 Tax=Rossellomorea marisflavi TaxID=189381 RepID=UPI003AE341E6
MNRLTEHLIVVSFDCLSSLDYPLLQELPHFRRLLDEGALCRNVRTIYPSVTYPCHTSIVTGNYPKRHGIINNTLIQPGRPSPDWYWHRSHIRGTTLYDEAKAAGLTTAALLWPVTAKANIDYNLPEIFANRPWHHQIMVSLMNGTPLYQIDLQRRFGSIRNGLEQPALDDFVLESAVHTIRTKKPGLALIHFTDLDTMRHYHGFSSKEAIGALHRHDDRLGRIMHALDESGCEYTLIALGDHSALDEETAIQLNVCFKQKGWITCDRKGKVTDWQVYAKGCDGSSYVYVRDDRLMDEVHQLLKALQKEEGIEAIITGYEAGLMGADGSAAFMLEAERGYYFKDFTEGHFLHRISPEDVKDRTYTWGSHGYSPFKKQYGTIFMAMGKGIRKTEIPVMNLVDEGPTMARLLGLDLGDTDGICRDELLDAANIEQEDQKDEKIHKRRE